MPLVLPTVSSLQRATACDASVVLEQAADGPPSASAKRGTLLGAWVAASLRGWEMPNLGRYKINWNLDELRAFLGEGEILCEAAFSLNDIGIAFLGENIGRVYPKGSVCGAADIVVKRKHALVADLKSGTFPVPEARDNWQIATLAMMSSRVFEFETVTGVVVRMERGGTWSFGEKHTWDRKGLDAIHGRLMQKWRSWEEAQTLCDLGLADPVAVQNPGCFFCRATACQFNRANKQESEAA